MKEQYFHEYFFEWMELYKKGACRPVTYEKYIMTHRRLSEIAPDLKLSDLNRRSYQSIINSYAETHERQTVKDFHTHLKAAIFDAVDEHLIDTNPTRNVVIKGKDSREKKIKSLSVDEFKKLIAALEVGETVNWDLFIYLIAKTGLRFAEALALTPNDFDFIGRKLSVSRTINYKNGTNDFIPTKTASSVRKISIDEKTIQIFKAITEGMKADETIFVNRENGIYNSTANARLTRVCKSAGIPLISIHGLRHTHASILFYNGVSVLSVSKRLGHANVGVTQETYLHIIKDLEEKDNAAVIRCLAEVG